MVPEYGPWPSSKGSDVWALGLHGYIRPPFRGPQVGDPKKSSMVIWVTFLITVRQFWE